MVDKLIFSSHVDLVTRYSFEQPDYSDDGRSFFGGQIVTVSSPGSDMERLKDEDTSTWRNMRLTRFCGSSADSVQGSVRCAT